MDLSELREKIDAVDDELVKLFARRMVAAGEIAEFKKANGLPILEVTREREILGRISSLAGEEFENHARVLFSTLFDLSRSYQSSRTDPESETAVRIAAALEDTPCLFPAKGSVACQGLPGAYSQKACDRMFSFADILYFRTFEGVFSAVEKGLCQYGVLPIENSTHGSVNEVYDLMRHHNFYIARSMKLHISHCLLALPGAELKDVREIVSHEQAIGQCGNFLDSLPGVRITPCENTAEAAKTVAESGRRELAAISSGDCASIYGLTRLKDRIANSDNNFTRFIVISKRLEIYPGSGKASIMFAVPDTPGSLSRTLAKFSSLGINLTKLESRPLSGSDFRYMFYMDIDASVHSPGFISLLSELENELELFVFLGNYIEV